MRVLPRARLTVVILHGVPPSCDTAKRPSPTYGEYTIVPPTVHVPPLAPGAGARTTVNPCATPTRFNFPSAKNPATVVRRPERHHPIVGARHLAHGERGNGPHEDELAVDALGDKRD